MDIKWKIYTQPRCSYCNLSKIALTEKNIKYEEINIKENAQALEEMRLANLKTVPQIYDDKGNHIGGYDQLRKKLNDYNTL